MVSINTIVVRLHNALLGVFTKHSLFKKYLYFKISFCTHMQTSATMVVRHQRTLNKALSMGKTTYSVSASLVKRYNFALVKRNWQFDSVKRHRTNWLTDNRRFESSETTQKCSPLHAVIKSPINKWFGEPVSFYYHMAE